MVDVHKLRVLQQSKAQCLLCAVDLFILILRAWSRTRLTYTLRGAVYAETHPSTTLLHPWLIQHMAMTGSNTPRDGPAAALAV